MSAYRGGYHEIPDHVRRIIDRDGEIEFTPPSFERWLGRLQMLRTIAAMGGFVLIWLVSYNAGMSWDVATIRGIVASVVFFFFAWAAGLFVFGEMYDAEVKVARAELEEKERERARRIEEYYRERLRAQEATGGGINPDGFDPGVIPSLGEPQFQDPVPAPPPPLRDAA